MRLVVVLLCVLISSCSKKVKNELHRESSATTFYFIRHAETIESKARDKPLSESGKARAVIWTKVLKDVDFDAIYSTNYKRTLATAQPLAEKSKLDIVHYHATQVNLDSLVTIHKGQHVLMVGHSNTTPFLVNKLLGEERYNQIDHEDHDNLYVVKITNDGVEATLTSIP